MATGFLGRVQRPGSDEVLQAQWLAKAAATSLLLLQLIEALSLMGNMGTPSGNLKVETTI